MFGLGCFRKCHFGIPRNTEFYTELVLFRVILRNFLLFNSAELRGIPYRFVFTEFRIPSNLATAFCIMQPGIKSKNFGRLPGPLKGRSGKKNHLHRLFDFFYEIKSKELEKKWNETVFTMEEDIRIKLCKISWHQKSRNSAKFRGIWRIP